MNVKDNEIRMQIKRETDNNPDGDIDSYNTLIKEENDENSKTNFIKINESKKKNMCTFKGCNAKFLRPSRLLRHMRQHTGERPFKCLFKDCDKAYTNSSHLNRHLLTHKNIKQIYNCPHCLKKISTLNNLKRHCTRMHSDCGDNLICKECGKKFKKIFLFQEHIAAHTNSPMIYKCLQCNLTFLNNLKFKRHTKKHEITSFECKTCKISFEVRKDYNEHLKSVHTNDYVCNICSKSFVHNTFLEKHKLTHTKVKIFSCPYENCYHIYYFKRNLNNHIKISHLNRKFTCDICKAQYKNKKNLKLHILKFHLSKDQNLKEEKKSKSKERKDKGMPTKSMISRLIGVTFPCDVEKHILNRIPTICMIKNDTDK